MSDKCHSGIGEAPTAQFLDLDGTLTHAAMFLPDVLTQSAAAKPTHPLYVYAEPDPSDTVVPITNLEFNRATHRAAHILRPAHQGADQEIVAVLALSDTLLYQALLVGLIRANLIPFPISPRNSPAAVVDLLLKTGCHRVVATCTTLKPLLAGVEQGTAQADPNFHLNIEKVPSLNEIYPNIGGETEASAFESYGEYTPPSFDDICIYLHSSGSTGMPKAIPQTHRALMQWASNGIVDQIRDAFPHPVAAMPLPSFHLAGMYGQLLQPIYGGITAALYPPTALSPEALPMFPTPDNILTHTRKTKSQVLMILPALLAVWSRSPDALAYLKTLALIGFAGGCLPRRLGDALVTAGLNLRSVYGATESGTLTAVVPLPGDEHEWEWLRFSDKVDLTWIPQGDGTFECHVLHSDTYTLGVENLDDVRGYATSDLFVNHPEKPHLWKVVGRRDDVIIHLSGENTVPAPMEDIVMSHPSIIGTVMFGRDHNQTGILIEPAPAEQIDTLNASEVAQLREKLWLIIEEANSIAPTFSRIFKEMIIFTARSKPLPRAGKGTVMRRAALEMYSGEIEALYETIEKPVAVDTVNAPEVWDQKGIQRWLLNLTVDLSQGSEITSVGDLFQQGFDSLSATFLQLRLVRAMRSSADAAVQNAAIGISQSTIYYYRSIDQLSNFLAGRVAGTAYQIVDAKQMIDDMIAMYTATLSPRNVDAGDSGGLATVLLTGSTGSLGSQILALLLIDPRVSRVYGLNRPSLSSLAERHRAVFNDRGLDTALLKSTKFVLVAGRTDQGDLGLSPELYEEIRSSVTLIIHNAWTLDFNLPLAAFEQHIAGTRNLIDLALSAPLSQRFLFSSSITSAMPWGVASGTDSSDNPADASFAASSATGYGQSKFVAEQILAKSGLQADCLRIGQICGSLPNGAWATSDWLPILVKSSITLGSLPLANGVVSWIDFDTVAHAVLEVAFSPKPDAEQSCSIMNLVHPRPVEWNFVMRSLHDLLETTAKCEGKTMELKLVSLSEWCSQLESRAAWYGSTVDDSTLPAIKLLDFFYHLSRASAGASGSEFGGIGTSTTVIQDISPFVKNARPVGVQYVHAWLKYWVSTGFL
ncbi:hypothetical protein C8R43DRAFT_1096467 [Mycena crocata]|nr:hypothetical protein C8R43DRAFT_1096467 [Mycena crocata]